MSRHNPQMYEYLLEGIGWSRSGSELDRLGVFARAHFTGPLLTGIEIAISNRRAQLEDGRGHSARHVPDASFDDLDDLVE